MNGTSFGVLAAQAPQAQIPEEHLVKRRADVLLGLVQSKPALVSYASIRDGAAPLLASLLGEGANVLVSASVPGFESGWEPPTGERPREGLNLFDRVSVFEQVAVRLGQQDAGLGNVIVKYRTPLIFHGGPTRDRFPSLTWFSNEEPHLSPISERPPYASLIRKLIEEDKIVAARTLLATAIQTGELGPEILKMQSVLAVPRVRRSKRTDADRTLEYRWLKQHSAEHRGKWIAVSGGELLVEADTVKELRTRLNVLKPAKAPLIHFVA